jgi:DNA-directed RNA polymerase subunit F
MEVIDEKVVSDAEAKETLDKRSGERELKFEQKNAQEILNKFVQIDAESARNLGADLFKIGKLRDRHIAAIINFLPQDKDDLRAVLQKDFATLTEDEANLVLETVKKFA